jgi:D-arabinose 1-dehydrogenase-like Zn-dependent alcohol dehydrogenase
VFRNGGYAEYATLRSESGVRIPESVDAAEAAPLLCAGVTVFNSIRRMNITAGEVVAVQGLGGLGHLAIQYCRKMGFRTVALSRGTSKKKFAMELGATDYIDIEATDVAEELQKLGGAALITVTATNSSIIPPLLNGLQPNAFRRGRYSGQHVVFDPEWVECSRMGGWALAGLRRGDCVCGNARGEVHG